MEKKVLFIAYYFPPIGGSGVQRSIKHVRYLPQFGYKPVVVTVKNGHNFAYDFNMLKEIPKGIKVYRSNSGEKLWLRKIIEKVSKCMSSVKKAINRSNVKSNNNNSKIQVNNVNKKSLKDKLFTWLEYNYYVPDTKIRWYKHAVKDIKKRVLKEEDIDIIYSTSGPYTDHLIALQIKKKTQLPWVADFRDPWIGYKAIIGRYNEKRIAKEADMEKEVVTQADVVINVTEPITEMYKQRYPEFSSKFITITNGFDKNDVEIIETNNVIDKFKMCYTGVMMSGESPESLIKVLEEISEENQQFYEDLSLNITGFVEDIYKDMFLQSKLKDKIKINSYVEHSKAIKIMKEASINLIILPDEEESKKIYTGKIFDYIMANRPILGIFPEDGIAADLINNCNIGRAVNHNKGELIKEYILEIYEKFKKGESLDTDSQNKCAQFDRVNISKQLARVFDDVSKNS